MMISQMVFAWQVKVEIVWLEEKIQSMFLSGHFANKMKETDELAVGYLEI